MVQRLRIATAVPALATALSEHFLLRIEGRTHPELLLPIELFRNLLSGLRGKAEGVAVLREAWSPLIARLNLPADLLGELVVVSDLSSVPPSSTP
jgi:hypothetical protein